MIHLFQEFPRQARSVHHPAPDPAQADEECQQAEAEAGQAAHLAHPRRCSRYTAIGKCKQSDTYVTSRISVLAYSMCFDALFEVIYIKKSWWYAISYYPFFDQE